MVLLLLKSPAHRKTLEPHPLVPNVVFKHTINPGVDETCATLKAHTMTVHM